MIIAFLTLILATSTLILLSSKFAYHLSPFFSLVYPFVCAFPSMDDPAFELGDLSVDYHALVSWT